MTMPRLRCALVAVALLAGMASASADDAGSCYTIPDPDARTFCLAKAHHDPGRCYAIQDPSLRSECLAEVRK